MILTKEYLVGFLSRTKIPIKEWSIKIIELQTCFVLKNEIYCNVFWVDLWYHYLTPLFKKQNRFISIGPQDLTVRVTITENLNLIQIPASMQNVFYYGNIIEKTPFKLPYTLNTIMLYGLMLFLMIYFFGLIAFHKSPILLYV